MRFKKGVRKCYVEKAKVTNLKKKEKKEKNVAVCKSDFELSSTFETYEDEGIQPIFYSDDDSNDGLIYSHSLDYGKKNECDDLNKVNTSFVHSSTSELQSSSEKENLIINAACITPETLNIHPNNNSEALLVSENIQNNYNPEESFSSFLSESNNEEHKLPEGFRLVDSNLLVQQVCSNFGVVHKCNCTSENLRYVKEVRQGNKSTFHFTCNMCGSNGTFETAAKVKKKEPNINEALVMGIVTSGGGFSQLEEVCAALNMPCMSQRQWDKSFEIVSKAINEAFLKETIAAGQEEAAIAIAEKRVDKDGVPLVAVVADGSWGRRSYGSKNMVSKSGVGVLIGLKTKKVLFIGIRNKYCSFCSIHSSTKPSEPIPDHKCFKNWNGTSTAMEADAIVEGFKQSVAMHGIKYHMLIGDGDSSVYRRILEACPYGKNLRVTKVECKNHILRNFRTKLNKIKENSKLFPTNLLKKLVTNGLDRIAVGATLALKHRQNEDKPFLEKVGLLKKDFANVVNHVYGQHAKCAEYFCEGSKEGEINLIPEIQKTEAWDLLNSAIRTLQHYAVSLIENVDTNIVESFNSVIVKLSFGKRVNIFGKNSYNARVETAAVSFNSSEPLRKINKSLFSTSPGKNAKKFIARRNARRVRNRERKHKRKNEKYKAKKKIDYGQPDHDYGVSQEPDMLPERMKEEKKKFFAELKEQAKNAKEIERETVGQSSNFRWLEIRKNLLTSSWFGKISRMRPSTSCVPTVKEILYKTFTGSAATRWGIEKEPVAKEELQELMNIQIDECGLFIDTQHPYLGASPDGLVGEDVLVEIKCPYKARFVTPEEGIRQKKITFLKLDGEDVVINDKHEYYAQIQGQLHICKRKICIFGVWTPKGLVYTSIRKDKQFYKNLSPKLREFYFKCLLPEIINPRMKRGQELRNPKRNITNFEKKVEIKQKNRKKEDNNKDAKKRKRKLEEKADPKSKKLKKHHQRTSK